EARSAPALSLFAGTAADDDLTARLDWSSDDLGVVAVADPDAHGDRFGAAIAAEQINLRRLTGLVLAGAVTATAAPRRGGDRRSGRGRFGRRRTPAQRGVGN